MPTTRFTRARIAKVLAAARAGATTAQLCSRHGITPATFRMWKSKYGDPAPSPRTLKRLENENAKLRKLLAYAQREVGEIRALLQESPPPSRPGSRARQ